MELSYEAWCSLSDEELSKRDIAEANLFAANNLPMAGKLDIASLRRKLDDWADVAEHGIRRVWKKRLAGERSDLTGDQFRVMVMITVLQRSLGVKYNWAFSHGEYDATDSRNLFIHGLLTGHGGTCVTMPVLYAAIGRRLGFPIRLVGAKQHTFCRWDDGNGERFNIEATSPGFNLRPDEFYHTWPQPITQIELERGDYLHSLTPREELAFFIGQRGNCLFDHLKTLWAVEAHCFTHQLAPENHAHRNHWAMSILLHRTMEHFRKERKENPHALAVPSLVPREDWERHFLPIVHGHIERILRNRNCAKSEICKRSGAAGDRRGILLERVTQGRRTMYDPKIGQFLSEDPIDFDGLDENLRRYVHNRVTSHIDPDGLQEIAANQRREQLTIPIVIIDRTRGHIWLPYEILKGANEILEQCDVSASQQGDAIVYPDKFTPKDKPAPARITFDVTGATFSDGKTLKELLAMDSNRSDVIYVILVDKITGVSSPTFGLTYVPGNINGTAIILAVNPPPGKNNDTPQRTLSP